MEIGHLWSPPLWTYIFYIRFNTVSRSWFLVKGVRNYPRTCTPCRQRICLHCNVIVGTFVINAGISWCWLFVPFKFQVCKSSLMSRYQLVCDSLSTLKLGKFRSHLVIASENVCYLDGSTFPSPLLRFGLKQNLIGIDSMSVCLSRFV